MMTKYTWSTIVVLLISAVVISFQLQKKMETTPVDQGATQSGLKSPEISAQGDTSTSHSVTGATAPAANPSEPKIEDPAFARWLHDEAKNIDAPSMNAEQKREEIKTIVRRLTPTQSRQLLATAKNPKAPASQKILSTYLLVEGGPVSRGELTDLITSPLADQGPHEPHSEAELVGVREKTLRIMAIDGLFSRAQKEPDARQALAKVISDIQDPYIKAYAQDKFQRLSR